MLENDKKKCVAAGPWGGGDGSKQRRSTRSPIWGERETADPHFNLKADREGGDGDKS